MTDWISVNDRMPDRIGLDYDECEYVIVYEHGILLGFHEYEQVSVCAYAKSGWDKTDCFGTIAVENITHWMPMPKPPKDERKEGSHP